MVLLTTIPIGRLLLALASIIHERRRVILEVLPLMIGTMYRNYHRPALIITFIFPDLLPKILQTSSQGHACPTRTYACLIKHYSKQPIGTPRLNLVPATPKLYKVVFHNVLVFLS